METKINLHLCANYNHDAFKSAVVNALVCDYVIEQVRLGIKRFSKDDLDLFYIHEEFKKAIEQGEDVTFANLSAWEANKVEVYSECVGIIMRLDMMATEAGKIGAGEFLYEFKESVDSFIVMLSVSNINPSYIDVSGVIGMKEEFLTHLVSQLMFVDEGQFLSDLGTMQLQMVPLEINKYRNKFVEKKLTRAKTILSSVSSAVERDFDRLHEEIMDAYKKFYKIAYAALSDGEKVDEARKVCKLVAPHRHILDKLEDRLTEANELKRQLHIHEKKLDSFQNEKIEEFNKLVEEAPYEKESSDREIDSVKFVTEEYITNIKATIEKINEIEEVIAERYKILDKVENALKAAIPSESEMKRYSGIGFKFQDLYVRLELAKSQIKDKDKNFVTAINTAIVGLGVLVNLGLEGKDIFLRNSLLTAVFNSVNGIYDIVDNKNKSVELSQIKFVTTRLVKYSLLNKNLTKDLQTFRRVCNNTIRDIAMMMGKPFSIATMVDIVDAINLAITQVQEIVDTLNKNHVEQTEILEDILNV
ncbi:MAG: hypothetical protein IJW59_04795 [Clostridia bacterium]|nr:hypothetical protein [Clostridia bacterium]